MGVQFARLTNVRYVIDGFWTSAGVQVKLEDREKKGGKYSITLPPSCGVESDREYWNWSEISQIESFFG